MRQDRANAVLRLTCAVGLIVGHGLALAENIEGVIDLNGASVSYRSLTGTGTLSNACETLSVVTLTGDEDATFDGKIVGNVKLVKTGAGVQTFTVNNNAYTGGTWIEGGVVEARSLDWIGAYGNRLTNPERMIHLKNGACVRATPTMGALYSTASMKQGVEVLPGETGVYESTTYSSKDGTFLFTNATLVLRGQHRLATSLTKENASRGTLRIDANCEFLLDQVYGMSSSAIPGFSIDVRMNAEVLVAADGVVLQSVRLAGGRLRTLPYTQTGNSSGALETLQPTAGSVPSITLIGSLTVVASERPSMIDAAKLNVRFDGSPFAVDVAEGGEIRLRGRLAPTSASDDKGLVKTGTGRLTVDGQMAVSALHVDDGVLGFGPDGSVAEVDRLEISPEASVRLEDGADVALSLPLLSGVLSDADVWVDATKIDAEDASRVDSLPNLGKVGGAFRPGTDHPFYAAGSIGALPSLSFNGSQYFVFDGYTNTTDTLTTFVVMQPTVHNKWSSPFSLSNTKGTTSTGEEALVGTYFYSFNGDDLTTFKAARGKVGTSTINWAFEYSLPSYGTGCPLLLEHRRNGSTAEGSAYWGEGKTECVKTNATGWLTQDITRVQLGGRMLGNGSPYTGRLHKGYIGEFLVFTRALSDAEYRAVETYLKNKWLAAGKAKPDLHGDEPQYGSRCEIDVPDGATARLSPSSSYGVPAGDYVKGGEGTLVAGDFTGAGRLSAEAGTLELAAGMQLPSKAAIWIDPSDPTTVEGTAASVLSVANKGFLGGSFVKNLGAGAKLLTGADGINGRTVLSFGGDSLMYSGFVRNDGSPRSLHVYAIVSRADYTKYTAPYTFAHSDWSSYDKKADGMFHFESNANAKNGSPIYRMLYGKDARGMTNATSTAASSEEGYYIDLPRRDAIGDVCLSVCRMEADWQLSAMELATDDVASVPWYGTTKCDIKPLKVNRVQLGGSMLNGGSSFGEGGAWRGRIGEFIVFEQSLTVAEETALLAYLRKKWLNKGNGSTVPPVCLAGKRFTSVLGDDLALSVSSPAKLVDRIAPQSLYELTLDGVAVERLPPTPSADGFKLFSVMRDMTLSGALSLSADVFPEAAKVPLVTYGGTGADDATWTVVDAPDPSYRVRHRPSVKTVFLQNGSGTVLVVR